MTVGVGQASLDQWTGQAARVLAVAAQRDGFESLTQDRVLRALLRIVRMEAVEKELGSLDAVPRSYRSVMREALDLLDAFQARETGRRLRASGSSGSAASPIADARAEVAREPRDRDVASEEGITRIRARQRRALTRFFAEPGQEAGTAEEVEADLEWSAHLELNDRLELVVARTTGLPKPVKTLTLATGDTQVEVVAANLRSGVTRIAVRPSVSGYRWSAGDFDEDLGTHLLDMAVTGLSASAATAFRVDTGGSAVRLSGNSLSPGNAYRVLLPPGLGEASQVGGARALETGWRVVELSLFDLSPEALAGLAGWGLKVGRVDIEATWVVSPPALYRSGSNGDRYAAFLPDAVPCLLIQGLPPSGDVRLVVTGDGGGDVVALPPGEDAVVRFNDLPQGCYVADVVCANVGFNPFRIPFAIDASEARVVPARAEVRVGGKPVEFAKGFEGDLSQLAQADVSVSGPPLWRVGALWDGATTRKLDPLFADGVGSVDLEPLFAETREHRLHDQHADLVLNLGELGSVTLHHTRAPNAEAVVDALKALLSERQALLDADLDLLFDQVVQPVCELLGHDIAAAGQPKPTMPPIRQSTLSTTQRVDGHIRAVRTAKLVTVPSTCDLRARGPDTAQALALAVAAEPGPPRVVLTNGRTWQVIDPSKPFQRAACDLPKLLQEGPAESVQDFLATFHA